MISCLFKLTALENEGAAFVVRFWRDVYRPMLTHSTRSALANSF